MCIYFKNQTNLTYTKQEHIFPAGLGGNQKLANGVVSDQANELFSRHELTLMRFSLIALDRMLFGPGKRGSTSIEKAYKSPITAGVDDLGKVVLSYTMLGSPYNIPQFHSQGTSASVTLPWQDGISSDNLIKSLCSKMSTFSGTFTHIVSKNVPNNDMIVGVYEDKFYVATANATRPSTEEVSVEIAKLTRAFAPQSIIESQERITQNHQFIDNENVARMYAKVCFNSLAFLKGEAYALQDCFDEIREWITGGNSKDKFFSLPNANTEAAVGFTKVFPEKSHWCLFTICQHKLIGYVCFYNHCSRMFNLGTVAEVNSLPFGFICDWKNEREYTLSDYLLFIAEENHKQLEQFEKHNLSAKI